MSKKIKSCLFAGLAVVVLLVFSGCADKEKTEEEQIADALQQMIGDAINGNGQQTSEPMLNEIDSYLTSDME